MLMMLLLLLLPVCCLLVLLSVRCLLRCVLVLLSVLTAEEPRQPRVSLSFGQQLS